MASSRDEFELHGHVLLEKSHNPRILTTLDQPEDLGVSPDSVVQSEQGASAQASFEKIVCKELGTPFRYRNVAVLIVHWAEYLDRHLKCGDEVEELRALFEREFHFQSKTLTLDDKKKPQLQLNNGISNFVFDHNGECRTHLLIVYYTGHGKHDDDDDGLHITGVRDPGGSRIGPVYPARARWSDVEKNLEEAEADVLTILDTCSAGSVVKGTSEDARSYEVLAATGRKLPTAAPGPRSFTRAMIDSLKEQLRSFDQTPFTTHELNQAIMRGRKNHSSHVFTRGSNRFVKLAPLHKPFLPSPTVPRASLGITLRFVFDDVTTLTSDQAKKLAIALSQSVASDSTFAQSGVEAKQIEWVDSCSIAGAGRPTDAARLQKGVRKVQRLWRASSAWRSPQTDSDRKRGLDDDAERHNDRSKRSRSDVDDLPTPSSSGPASDGDR